MSVITRFPFLSLFFPRPRLSVHQVTIPERDLDLDSIPEFVTMHTCTCGHKHSVDIDGIGSCRTCDCQTWRRT